MRILSLYRSAAQPAMAQWGRWWMCEEPALGARVLDEFFATLV